jgi:SAM-dependent methyltransferase
LAFRSIETKGAKMPNSTAQDYLLADQYKSASNLDARMALHTRFGTNPVPWHRWVFDRLDLPPTAQILEIGCGPGKLWRENVDRIPAGWDITLSDFSPGMLAEAREYLADAGHDFTYREFDAQAIPLPDSSLDAVIANHMLYHVPDRAKTYAEVGRVLKPGGRFYAAANGRDSMRKIKEIEQDAPWNPDRVLIHRDGLFRSRTGRGGARRLVWRCRAADADGHLVVTEAQPLIDYILSTARRDATAEDKPATLRRVIDEEIARTGAVRIEKITGMLVARQQ